MEQSLDSYKLVVAPMLYMFRSGIETKLRTFVENGGILIMTYWSGIVNETDLCYLEELHIAYSMYLDLEAKKLMDSMNGKRIRLFQSLKTLCNCILPINAKIFVI